MAKLLDLSSGRFAKDVRSVRFSNPVLRNDLCSWIGASLASSSTKAQRLEKRRQQELVSRLLTRQGLF